MGSFSDGERGGRESGLVRIGELAAALDMPIKTLRRLADIGEIPSQRTAGGHRVFDFAEVRAALRVDLITPGIVPDRLPEWIDVVELNGLDEAEVWARVVQSLRIDRATEGARIAAYGFTEILNNAIDHSHGSQAISEVWLNQHEFAFRITDDGEGVFAHLSAGLHLENTLEAAAELTKGKRTTWRERHTGEGIFFTSKSVTEFRISANGLRLTVDNNREDTALGVSAVTFGSVVEATITLPPPHTLRSVFEQYADEDQRFTRSRPVVKLFASGLTFVSRSEARRLMEGMDAFEDIDLDFAGVDDVGQGFVDEIVRVWPSLHPGVRVTPVNMNDAVAFMVRRAAPSD
jgi:anti-sigma regulatory factor (Ser/Thr protein kinase)